MLGFILASFLMFLIMIGIFTAAVAGFSKKEVVSISQNSILQLTLDKAIEDRSSNNPFQDMNMFNFKPNKAAGLNQVLESINKASKDEKVSGIFLELKDVPSGLATVEEIRNALLNFKKSGKFIYSYGDFYTQKSYYLASVSDSVFLNPEGAMELKGLVSQSMFFKGLLDKLMVQPQVIRHGKFKSAIEPFTQQKMSEDNRLQTQTMLNSIWNHFVEGIATQRGIPKDEINNIANEYKLKTAEDAVNNKLIDALMYKDQILSLLASRTDTKEIDKLKFVTLSKYINTPDIDKKSSSDRVAIIYATGNIINGEGDDTKIGSDRISKEIRKARLNKKVKAIVLRVNSPGGDALASEVIWREALLAKQEKPFIVSMGNVAASGGYYISCAADKVFANQTTITGSIGVFGVIPNTKDMFEKKLGITFDEVKTTPYADFITGVRPMTDAERQIITQQIENVYGTFISRVAEGRKITTAQVDSIGQGRIWSGIDARSIKLIDEFGGLEEAVKEAANMAQLKDYKVVEYPVIKDPFALILESLEEYKTRMVKSELGELYPYFKYLNYFREMKGIQALMPVDFEIN